MARHGLQAERTQLSWERTAIGFLAGGAIPLLRQGGPLAVGRTSLAVLAILLALLVVWLGYVRAKRMPLPPKAEIYLIGGATAVFGAIIVVFLALGI
jgi:putative membrane protein